METAIKPHLCAPGAVMNVFSAKQDKFQLPVWPNALLLTLVKMEKRTRVKQCLTRRHRVRSTAANLSTKRQQPSRSAFCCRPHQILSRLPHVTHNTNPLQGLTVITENELWDTGKAAKVKPIAQMTLSHSQWL